MANLDRIAAKHAQKIISDTPQGSKKEDVENVLTKALGVCQEQGIYASLLYLLSRSNDVEEPIAQTVKRELVALLSEPELAALALAYNDADGDAQSLLDHFAGTVCAAPVQTVFFVKDMFERTLTYARYSAKARQS